MNVLSELTKRPTPMDSVGISVFLGVSLYALLRGQGHTLVAGLAFVLMMLGALPKQVALALLVGASVIILLQTRRSEGFESGSATKEAVKPKDSEAEASGEAEEDTDAEVTHDKDAADKDAEEKKNAESFGNGKVVLPDNATRMEPLELGKPYKLPSEADDKGFHLDSGTTFLNAYKSLKPDQIAAMTKDTQELMATQKNLMATLETLKPMLADGQNMMNMFGSFFGSK